MDFSKNQTVILLVLIGAVATLLALAMWFGLDLSWVPGLIEGLVKNVSG